MREPIDLASVVARVVRESQGVKPGLKELVEAHEGRVEVESKPGERTRFSVRLPRRPSPG